MDRAEAARRLSVAEHEVVDVRTVDGRVEVLHHDMASHVESWRRVWQDVVEFALEAAQKQPERDSGVEGSPESGSGEVPDGTRDDVLAWVGDDSDRAVAALEAEEQREQSRTTLIAALEKVIG
jgi:hypothetical protein